METEHRFSEQEVSLVLQSAAEIEARSGVPAEVSREELRELVARAEDAVGKPGTVTVHERYQDRLRPMLHAIPNAWRASPGIAVGRSLGIAGLPVQAVVGAGAVDEPRHADERQRRHQSIVARWYRVVAYNRVPAGPQLARPRR